MTDDLRQRRGKRSDHTSATTKSDEILENSRKSTNEVPRLGKPTPIEQLQTARSKIVVSRDRTADLHIAWRCQLFRLSLLIVLVSLHQFQSSISSCLREIKSSNDLAAGSSTEKIVSGTQALSIVISESICELLGVIISFFLSYYLSLSREVQMEMDSWPYMMSSVLVPMQLGLYFHTKQLGCLGENESTHFDDLPPREVRQFPVVVIYHTIVTLAFWFMKNGMNKCEENVALVEGAIRDFERMNKKLKSGDKSRRK